MKEHIYKDITDKSIPSGVYCVVWHDDTIGFKETLVWSYHESKEDAEYYRNHYYMTEGGDDNFSWYVSYKS